MKKPIIVLIIFFVTISAFAEDKPSYTKNFSLVKVSEANNRMFFEFLEVKAFIDREKNPGDVYGLIFRQQKEINSEQTKFSLAEEYLRRLARTSKKARKVGGTMSLILGGVAAGLAVTIPRDEEDIGLYALFRTIFIVEAVGSMVGGVYLLAVPSAAEKKLDDVLGVSDPGRRERASEEALASLARSGRRSRIIMGILWTGLSASALAVGEAQPLLLYGGLAALSFMIKSRAERTLQSYLKEKELQKKLEFRLGILPYSGVKIGFVYSF